MRNTAQIIPNMVCVFLLLPLMSVPAANAVEILTKKFASDRAKFNDGPKLKMDKTVFVILKALLTQPSRPVQQSC